MLKVKDFHQHQSNGGVAMATTIDEIRDLQAQERSRPKGQG